MKSFLVKSEPYIYAIFRIVLGFLFLWHGSMKLFGFPPSSGGGAMPMFVHYIGGSIEFFGGILVMFGLFTSVAAFLSSGQMAVAYWMAHASHGFLPAINHGELAVIYCFAFLLVTFKGPGLLSLDLLIFKRKK